MSSRDLDELMSVGEHLTILIAAGVPLDVGLGRDGMHASAVVERTNAVIARQVSRGVALDEAVRQCDAAPLEYRSLLLAWLRGSDLARLLNSCVDLGASRDDSRHSVRAGLYYPLLVCALAWLGVIGFSLYLVPALTGMYSAPESPGPWLQSLQRFRDALPLWIVGPPSLLGLVVLGSRFAKTEKRKTAGGNARLTEGSHRTAAMADLLADLLEAGTPLDEALELAAGACGEGQLRARPREMPGEPANGGERAARRAADLPPLLSWALTSPEAVEQRAALVRTSAGLYRDLSDVRAQRAVNTTTIVLLIAIGGGATLGYALMLMLPVVEMLLSLARITP